MRKHSIITTPALPLTRIYFYLTPVMLGSTDSTTANIMGSIENIIK